LTFYQLHAVLGSA